MSKKWKFGRIMDTGVTYLILIAVAFVFFFPCLWLILASFSKSGTIYSFDGFFPKEYSLASFQLPEMVFEHTFCGDGKLYFRNVSCNFDGLYDVKIYVQSQKTNDENHNGTRNVPFFYGDDCGLSLNDAV